MPGPAFRAYALQGVAAVDAVMAEAWTLQPRRAAANPNAAAVADPDRWSGMLQATFVDPQARPEMPNSYDLRQTRRAGLESGRPHLLVSPAAVAAMQAAASATRLPVAIRQGDQLLRQDGGAIWKVESVFPLAGGTLKLAVGLLG